MRLMTPVMRLLRSGSNSVLKSKSNKREKHNSIQLTPAIIMMTKVRIKAKEKARALVEATARTNKVTL